MNFLCLGHRKLLSQQYKHQQQSLWQEWMTKASLHYEFQQWSQAASYFGCAFELSCITLAKDYQQKEQLENNLTLAAIYLVNCFEHLKEYQKAELFNNECQQILLSYWSKNTDTKGCGICLNALIKKPQQAVFLQQFSQLVSFQQAPL